VKDWPPAVRIGLWMSFTAVGFAIMLNTVRYLSDTGLHFLVTAFWRNVFAILFLSPWIVRFWPSRLGAARWRLYGLRAVVMTISTATLFWGATLLPVAEATALSFTTPLFTVIGAIIFLNERVGWRRWAALLLGFSGILIMLRPGAAAFELGALVVLAAAITFATVNIIGKILAHTDSPGLITLNLSLYALPVSLVLALPVWQWPAAEEWLWLCVVGIAAVCNIYGISAAFRAGDASLAQAFDFLRLPATALLALLWFDQFPDVYVWIGTAVIAGSSIYIAHRESKRHRGA
jgi:drug/metabolite transporter (DMT)-like permease